MNTSRETPGYHRLRKGRISLPQHMYLLTTVCSQRHPWFANDRIAETTSHLLRDPCLWRDSTPLCWVLMPDHFHLVLHLGSNESLQHLMNRIKSLTSRAARSAGHAPGPVWMAGFHDRAIRREDDVAEIVRYVLGNPVRAGLTASIDAYPHRHCVWDLGDLGP
jgi:REP element-mobilizing transposase RayT